MLVCFPIICLSINHLRLGSSTAQSRPPCMVAQRPTVGRAGSLLDQFFSFSTGNGPAGECTFLSLPADNLSPLSEPTGSGRLRVVWERKILLGWQIV